MPDEKKSSSPNETDLEKNDGESAGAARTRATRTIETALLDL
jgi:hypothetical protein|tara:strand:+ start:42 stop:167 length:126 start_codon:yes stop_codon:yes gene_type:complete